MKQTAIRHLWPLLALALLVWGAPAAAQTGAAVLRVEPESLSLAAGQMQTVAIVIQDAAEVYGIDVRAGFDPALVEIVDADPARDGVQMTPGAFPQPDFVALNAADNAAGALRYAVTQVNPTPPANGGGTVFTFQVRGRANGVSPLRVTLVEMANRSGELLPVTTRDGAITVTGGQPPAPTGVALTVPAEGGSPPAGAGGATAAPEATVGPAPPAPPAGNTPPTSNAATVAPIAGEATNGPAGSPNAPQPALTNATGATVPPGATAVPLVETDDGTPAAAIAGQTTTDLEAATTTANASDTAAESAAPPSVIGAGQDAAGPGVANPPPSDASPGGALLIGGVIVLFLLAAAVVLARRR